MQHTNTQILNFLFMQFNTLTPTLDAVAQIYFPHLCKANLLEKARKNDFKFKCFKIDDSQKAPYFVNILDLANILEDAHYGYNTSESTTNSNGLDFQHQLDEDQTLILSSTILNNKG